MALRERMKERSVSERLKHIEMRIQFAEICLETKEQLTNERVYKALTHLAMLPELGIEINMFESMNAYPDSKRLNIDIYNMARSKVKEAKDLRNKVLGDNYAFK